MIVRETKYFKYFQFLSKLLSPLKIKLIKVILRVFAVSKEIFVLILNNISENKQFCLYRTVNHLMCLKK